MITAPPLAVLPPLPVPDLGAGLALVAGLATTASLTALVVLIVGLLTERRAARVVFRRPIQAPRADVRPAA